MTAERLLVDTNVLVYHLGGRTDATKALQGVEVHISFITEIELQSKASLTPKNLTNIQAAIVNYRISDINPAIKQLAALLRRTHGLKLVDAIIAATALHLDLPILSADGGFERVKARWRCGRRSLFSSMQRTYPELCLPSASGRADHAPR